MRRTYVITTKVCRKTHSYHNHQCDFFPLISTYYQARIHTFTTCVQHNTSHPKKNNKTRKKKKQIEDIGVRKNSVKPFLCANGIMKHVKTLKTKLFNLIKLQ